VGRRFSTGKPNLQVVGGFFMPVLLPARGRRIQQQLAGRGCLTANADARAGNSRSPFFGPPKSPSHFRREYHILSLNSLAVSSDPR
jgi:hypothetical protein